jgi:hypothetical protein
MNNMTTTRMLLSTAVLAAVAAVFAGGANAVLLDVEGGSSGLTGVHAALANRAAHPAAVDNTLDPAIRRAIEDRAVALTGDSALKVDRAVAAANEAFDTYRDKTAIAAREALFTDQQPSVGLTGDAALTRSFAPQPAVMLPTASSASDGVDWAWFALGAGMTALLAAGIAGVVLTTRRRGDIALP